jgi:tRNA nucleotidyltransferase (CCA-adding enzyme)
LFEDFTYIKRADILAQSDYKREEKLEKLEALRGYYDEVMSNNQCISLKELAITGSDLIALGLKPGPEIGEVLNGLLDKVIDDPSLNDKDKLIEIFNNRK